MSPDVLDYQLKPYSIKIFGGADNFIRDTLSKTERGDLAEFCRFDTELGSLTKAIVLGYATGTSEAGSASTKIDSFYRHYNTIASSPAGQWYAFCDGDFKTYTAGAWATDLSTAPTAGEKGRFISYDANLYAFTKSANPLKIVTYTAGTGTRATAACELGACYAVLSSGGSITAGAHYYIVTITYGGTEFINGAVSNTITTTGANGTISLYGIPKGPIGTTNRKIYRTDADGNRTTCRLVNTISDNTTTSWVSDTTADGAGAVVGADTDDIPTVEFAIIHKERGFYTGNTTYRNRLYYTTPYSLDFLQTSTATVTYEEIAPDDNDQIMQIVSFLNSVAILKRSSIRRLYTEGTASQWSLSDTLSPNGTVASDSVAVTPIGVIYLGYDGFYLFNGNFSRKIITQFNYNNILKSRLGQCVGYYHEDKYHFAYPDASVGESENNRYMIYDITKDIMIIESRNFSWFCAARGEGDTGDLFYSDSQKGFIYGPFKSTKQLVYRTQNDFDTGANSNSNHKMGTQTEPKIMVSWDPVTEQIQDLTVSAISTMTTNTILTSDHTSGTYTSASAQISAGSLGSLYWNEEIDASKTQNVLFYARTGATQAACEAADWSTTPYTEPTGSVFAETANVWLQWKVTLSTGTAGYSPYVYSPSGAEYAVKLTYNEVATAAESSLLMRCRSGWRRLSESDVILQKLELVYYTDSLGTLIFKWEVRGLASASGQFDINLGTYPKRYEVFFPAEATGKEIRVELQNSDINSGELTIKECNLWLIELPLI